MIRGGAFLSASRLFMRPIIRPAIANELTFGENAAGYLRFVTPACNNAAIKYGVDINLSCDIDRFVGKQPATASIAIRSHSVLSNSR
jgi:hypothetical protein